MLRGEAPHMALSRRGTTSCPSISEDKRIQGIVRKALIFHSFHHVLHSSVYSTLVIVVRQVSVDRSERSQSRDAIDGVKRLLFLSMIFSR
jgi:hypothetical protein